MKILRRLTWLLIAIVTTYNVAFASPERQVVLQGEDGRQFEGEVMVRQTDVLVLSRDGTPVGDLTAGDFELYEDGVRQEINGVELVEKDASGRHADATPRRFVFVVNRLGARFSAMVAAKQALRVFVEEAMADGDEAMVVELAYSTRVLQQFTPSRDKTLETIHNIVPLTVHDQPLFSTLQFYESMESLGQELQLLPGRKIVILMSYEPNRGRERTRAFVYLDDAVDALNQANATVYSINLGLFNRLFTRLSGRDLGGLSPIATQTGGRYFFQQSQHTFLPIVREIGRQNRRYYVLTYTPSNPSHDGSYRRLEVRVNRPGLDLRSRPGYFAPVETAVADDR